MPYALVIIGLVMIVTGILNTYVQLATQLQSDAKGFVIFFVAIFAVGALGYINDLRQFSHYFMALIIISFVLSNKGVFANLQSALKAGPTAPTASAESGGGSQTAISPNASTGTIDSAITSNQQGVGGSTPATSGQAKFNGWMNYLFGLGTNSAGATQ